jgi:hypothetical protein
MRTLFLPLISVFLLSAADAWTWTVHPSSQTAHHRPMSQQRTHIHSSTASISDEYEYVEYEYLAESDFAGSEWLVGTVWEGGTQQKIEETWCRLAVDDNGKNIAVWGDKAQGKWAFDAASQFLSVSKENFLGKRIWACTVDDYYYLQGTVRGWTYLQPASVLGQWQAKRLGVTAEEAGPAPWFSEESNEESSSRGSKETQ